MRNRIFLHALFTALVALTLTAGFPAGARRLGPCEMALTRQTVESAKIALTQTVNTPLASYFPDTIAVQLDDSTVQVTAYNPENLDAFMRDVMAIVGARGRLLRFPVADFQKWLWAKHSGIIPLPEAFAMQNVWVRERATIGDFSEDLVQGYLRDTVVTAPSRSGWGAWLPFHNGFRNPLPRFGRGLGAALFMTVVLQLQGPISGFVNVPLYPINDYTGRLGTRYLSWSASLLNDLVNKVDSATLVSRTASASQLAILRAQLLQSADALGKYDYKGLSRDQNKEIWDAFEKRWFDYAQGFGKMLNFSEASGRDSYLSARLGNPEAYAINIALVKTNIQVTRTGMENLREKIARTPGGQPTVSEVEELHEYENSLQFDKRLLAVILCDWMLNHMFHPEAWNAVQLKNSGEATFQSIDEYLGFPEFTQVLKGQITEVFTIMDDKLKGISNSIPEKPSESPSGE